MICGLPRPISAPPFLFLMGGVIWRFLKLEMKGGSDEAIDHSCNPGSFGTGNLNFLGFSGYRVEF